MLSPFEEFANANAELAAVLAEVDAALTNIGYNFLGHFDSETHHSLAWEAGDEAARTLMNPGDPQSADEIWFEHDASGYWLQELHPESAGLHHISAQEATQHLGRVVLHVNALTAAGREMDDGPVWRE